MKTIDYQTICESMAEILDDEIERCRNAVCSSSNALLFIQNDSALTTLHRVKNILMKQLEENTTEVNE